MFRREERREEFRRMERRHRRRRMMVGGMVVVGSTEAMVKMSEAEAMQVQARHRAEPGGHVARGTAERHGGPGDPGAAGDGARPAGDGQRRGG